MLLWALLLLTYLALTNGATSREAKCLISCYAKCLSTGTNPAINGSWCNCTGITNQKSCLSNFDESIIQNSVTNAVLPVKTAYLNSRSIRIQMNDDSIHAAVYIFEYSTVSTEPDDWIFAGANSSPDVNFTVDDPCRDYQFRVIAILRKNSKDRWLTTYRPRVIPVDLPVFAIAPDKIQTAPPIYNAEDRTVVVYVSWENPNGYSDADIYGYEGPAIYPVQCNSPEAELPSPSVELNKGGGRLRISLPSEVLDRKCRVWAEVQMLPRCIRLEPFNIQQSFELDCEKLTTVDVCRHELAPQCTDVIDVWGDGNNATIMWSPQVSFGIPLYYHVRYGPAEMQGIPPLAYWKIASLHELKTTGNSTKLQLQVDPDIDYGIQICGVYNEHRKKPKFELMRVIPFTCTSCRTLPVESFGRCGECTKIEGPLLFGRRCHPKGGIGCTLGGAVMNITDDDILLNQLTVLPSNVFIDSSEKSLKTDVASRQPIGPIHESLVTSIRQPSSDSTSGLETFLAKPDVEMPPSEATRDKLSSSTKHSINETKQTVGSNNYVLGKMQTISTTSVSVVMIRVTTTVKIPHIVTATNDLKLQSNLNSCVLSNGVICEFGCINQTKCDCPRKTHILMDNGACLQQSRHGPAFMCFSNVDVKASWNPWIHSLHIQSKKIYDEIKTHPDYDRLFLEFGRVKYITNGQTSFDGVMFDGQNEKSNKVIIRTNKILQSGLFRTVPYTFYTNQTIDPIIYQYALRICAFTNSKIKNPFTIDWSQSTKQSMLYLNNVQFELGFMENVASNEKKQITSVAIVIIPVILIVLLVFLLVVIIYMNCTRLKRCYDRRKTRHFRPFVWNGSIPAMCNSTIQEKNSTIITKSSF